MRVLRIALVLSMVALATWAYRSAAATGAYPNGTSVVETLHNLSHAASNNVYGAGSLRDYGEVCVYCHTPHGGQTSAPLWNRNFSTATYQMYDGNHSSTIDMTVDPQPTGVSQACLSCHDGTVAVDSFGGVTGTTPISAVNNLGTSLADDHPIGFIYNSALATADGALFDPSTKNVTIGSGSQTKTGTIASLLLYNGKMECSSCHDVHNTFTVGTSHLVKLPEAGSQICLACHNK